MSKIVNSKQTSRPFVVRQFIYNHRQQDSQSHSDVSFLQLSQSGSSLVAQTHNSIDLFQYMEKTLTQMQAKEQKCLKQIQFNILKRQNTDKSAEKFDNQHHQLLLANKVTDKFSSKSFYQNNNKNNVLQTKQNRNIAENRKYESYIYSPQMISYEFRDSFPKNMSQESQVGQQNQNVDKAMLTLKKTIKSSENTNKSINARQRVDENKIIIPANCKVYQFDQKHEIKTTRKNSLNNFTKQQNNHNRKNIYEQLLSKFNTSKLKPMEKKYK